MSRMMKIIIIAIALLMGLSSVFAQVAGDFRSKATGNWSDYTKWQRFGTSWVDATAGQIPTATSNVTIIATHVVTVDIPDAVAASIVLANTVTQGVTLTISAGNALIVSGNITQGNTSTSPNADHTVAINVYGSLTANNVTLNADRSGQIFRSTSLRIGDTTNSTASLTVNGTLTLTNDSSNTLYDASNYLYLYGKLYLTGTTPIAGTFTTYGRYNRNIYPGSEVIYDKASAQSIRAVNTPLSYSNLTLKGSGTRTLSSNVTVDGVLTMTQGVLAFGAYTFTYGVGSSLVYNGVTVQTVGVEWNSTFDKPITNTNPAGVSLNASKAAYSGILTNDGKLICGNYQLTGTVQNNGIFTTDRADYMSSGTLHHNAGSTIDYTDVVVILAEANFKNVILSATSGLYSLGGAVTIANDFVMGSNSLNLNGFALQLTEKDIVMSGTNTLTAMTIIKSTTPVDVGAGTPSIKSKWEIGGSSTGDVNVTVSWLTAADNGIDFEASISNLWFFNGAVWQLLSPIPVSLTEPRTASFVRTLGAGIYTIAGSPAPPHPVTLVSPLQAAINVDIQPQLSWTPALIGAPATDFNVYFGADAGLLSLVGTLVASPFNVPAPLEYSTSYFWKVVAHNINGFSANNAVYSFTTIADPTPPNPVTLVAPAQGAINQIILPELSWTAPLTGTVVTSYKVYCDTNADPVTLVGTPATSPYTFTAALQYATTYYWKVISNNVNGDSGSNIIRSFTTMADPTPPNPVISMSPASGAIEVSLLPTLSWTPSPTGTTATSFYVYFSTDADSLVLADTLAASPYIITTPLTHDTAYFWKVIAHNANGSSIGNALLYFTTATDPTKPNSVTLLYPNNTLPDVSVQPEFRWTPAGDGGHASCYYVYCDTNADPVTLVGAPLASPFTLTVPTTLEYATTYYWRVVAHNAFGDSDGNAVFSFTTMAIVTNLNTPVVSIALDAAGKPRLTWAAVPYANSYYIYSDINADGAFPAEDAIQVSGAPYQPDSSTPVKFYKVRASQDYAP